jgi:hypothetical protein
MAKQMIKGLTMLLLVVALSLVTAVVSAKGQSSRRQTANIPFTFIVGDNELSAGKYSVEPATSTGEALKISGTENGTAMFRMSSQLDSRKPVEKGKLVFHRYGNKYFLAEVWTAGQSQGRQLSKSKGERAIEREYTAIRSRSEQDCERVEIALVRQ